MIRMRIIVPTPMNIGCFSLLGAALKRAEAGSRPATPRSWVETPPPVAATDRPQC
jgi:hypothetical protein